MDDWGDPWAEDSIEKKTARTGGIGLKNSFGGLPVLKGFEDEAQWGDESAGSGSTSWTEEAHEERLPDKAPKETLEHANSGADIAELVGESGNTYTSSASSNHDASQLQTSDSDSSITIHPDTSEKITNGTPTQPEASEDENSTRPSSSPSETSGVTESIRTSFEDENFRLKDTKDPGTTTLENTSPVSENSENEDFGNFAESVVEDEQPKDPITDTQNGIPKVPIEDPGVEKKHAVPKDSQGTAPLDVKPSDFVPNLGFIKELFPIDAPKELLEEAAPDEPIFSTPAKRTWYRITRKETLREFKSGNDENYVQVTWPQSKIRTDLIAIVSKWKNEDRIRQSPWGASPLGFNWDKSPSLATPDSAKSHNRAASWGASQNLDYVPPSNRFSVPQFTWSSAAGTATNDDNVSTKPVSKDGSHMASPNADWKSAQPHDDVAAQLPTGHQHTIQKESTQAASIKRQDSLEKQTPSIDAIANTGDTPVDAINAKASLPSQALPKTSLTIITQQPAPPTESNPWTAFSSSEKASSANLPSTGLPSAGLPSAGLPSAGLPIAPQQINVNNAENDDDEWGEMIQSPTTDAPVVPFFENFNEALSSPVEEKFSLSSTIDNRLSIIAPPSASSISSVLSTPANSYAFSATDFANFETLSPRVAQHKSIRSVSSADFVLQGQTSRQLSPVTPAFTRPLSMDIQNRSASPIRTELKPLHSEKNDQQIVRDLLSSLPDLGYMLR